MIIVLQPVHQKWGVHHFCCQWIIRKRTKVKNSHGEFSRAGEIGWYPVKLSSIGLSKGCLRRRVEGRRYKKQEKYMLRKKSKWKQFYHLIVFFFCSLLHIVTWIAWIKIYPILNNSYKQWFTRNHRN
jgi:hypothetical protein